MNNAYYLNCHSYFSLRYGSLSPEQLVDLARSHEIEALALTDIHSTAACFPFIKACQESGIHPVVGMEFRNGDELLYVALAENLDGFQEINEFYSRYQERGDAFPELPPYWSHVFIVYPWERRDKVSLSEREFLGVASDQLGQLLRSRYRHRQQQLVIWQPVSFADKKGHNVHRLLRAIDHNLLLSKLQNRQQAHSREQFVAPAAVAESFSAYPQLIANTQRLLAACQVSFRFGQNHSRQSFTGDKYDDMLLLDKLAREGVERRYHPTARKTAYERLNRELAVIDRLDFNAYYLITWDFVTYGQSRGFFHVGRGSGANSLVAYCLGLSDVDPIELNLYFERFLNHKRGSPPDFDIDYSWTDRDAVIEYVLRRYRKSHTALLATHTCFKGKASIRELGKVFGLPKKEIDRLVFYRHEPEKALDKLSKQVLYYASMLDGMPNHLGIHAGGILVSEQPIYRYTGTNLPPKNFPITHFDMHIAEDIGLHKFDVLSQRGLGHIRECVRIVKDNQGENLDIHATDEFKEDPQVREMLKKGKTMGCFYVESPAMRGLLAKLRCEDYPTLVAASSIIRPGVARSGMMRAYIERHNGRLFHSLHPRLKEILHDTYEVMVYQEDVIKVAHEFAGMDLADADLLRRIMSGKAKGKKQKQFEALKQRFFDCCGEKGYPQDTVSELWRQIESFGGYSFAKGHSASFAVESYQSLYLKTYYPLEFMVAVINNFGGFYDTEIYVHEARMWGANIHLPCVNHSSYHTRIIGKDIYLGFCHLKDLGEKVGQEIERERLLRGDFTDMADFARRLRIAEKDLVILVRIGAFRFSGRSKPHLLWEVKLHLCPADAKQQADVLFDPGGEGFELPVLATDPLEDAYDEMELLGFPMMSPFKLIESYNLDQFVLTKDLRQHVDTIVEMLGYLVCVKTTKTVHGDRMYFANFIDPAGEMFDVTIFPPEAKQIGFPGRGVYRITGKVAKDFTYCSLELVDVAKCVYRVDPRLERV